MMAFDDFDVDTLRYILQRLGSLLKPNALLDSPPATYSAPSKQESLHQQLSLVQSARVSASRGYNQRNSRARAVLDRSHTAFGRREIDGRLNARRPRC